MGDEPVNALNKDATQKEKVNKQHQNVAKPIVQRDLIVLLTIHKKTPQIITQLRVANVHNDDNHELVNYLMKSYLLKNHGNLQPQVTIYPKLVHLHQLQHQLVFKTNHHILTFIWYPLIQRWNDFTYSTNWNNFIMLTEDCLINRFLYHMLNMLNPKQHPHLFNIESLIHKALHQRN